MPGRRSPRSPRAPSASGSARWSRRSRSGRAGVLAKKVVTVDHISARARRARHRRRLVRGGARRLRVPVPHRPRAARRARPAARGDQPAVARWRTTSGRSRCSSPGRRSSSAAARSRGRSARRSGSPTSTTPSSPRSTRRASAGRPSSDAAREAGREPLAFSMMTSCVVGRDGREADERLRAYPASSGAKQAADRGNGRAGNRDADRIRARRRLARDAAAHAHEDVEMVACLARSPPRYARRRCALSRTPRRGGPGEPDALRPLTPTAGRPHKHSASSSPARSPTPSSRARCFAP